jgi:hypothetical protein
MRNRIKNNTIFAALISLGFLTIFLSEYYSPKPYKNTKELEEEKKIETDKIIAMLGNKSIGTFSPSYKDRNFWENISPKPIQTTPSQEDGTNNPSPIETIQEGTKQECFFNTGAWVESIEKAIDASLNEEWFDKELFDKRFVDLETTRRAAILASCIGLIGEKLDQDLVKRAKKEIKVRVLDPYLKDIKLFQHKELRYGVDQCPWLGSTGNWSAVCTANILYCAMITSDSPKELGEIIEKAQASVSDYFESFEDDGYLSEGIRYWNYGFSHFLILAEIMLKTTGGKINLYENRKIPNMIEFALKSKIGEKKEDNIEYYLLFADNSNPVESNKQGWEWYVLSKRTELPFKATKINKSEYAGPKLDLLLNMPNTKKDFHRQKIKNEDKTIIYESAGVLISKWNNGKEAFAIKGGTNRENHNHNDIGSYTMFAKTISGKFLPITGDIGDIEYTRASVGKDRYSHHLISSYGHPTPLVNNQLQNNSPEAKAKIIKIKSTSRKDEITYELKDAYAVSSLASLTREAKITKDGGGNVEITDRFKSKKPITFQSPIITAVEPKINDEGQIEIKADETIYIIEIKNPSEVLITIEKLDQTGFKETKRGMDKDLFYPHRTGLSLLTDKEEGEISYKIYKKEEGD